MKQYDALVASKERTSELGMGISVQTGGLCAGVLE